MKKIVVLLAFLLGSCATADYTVVHQDVQKCCELTAVHHHISFSE